VTSPTIYSTDPVLPGFVSPALEGSNLRAIAWHLELGDILDENPDACDGFFDLTPAERGTVVRLLQDYAQRGRLDYVEIVFGDVLSMLPKHYRVNPNTTLAISIDGKPSHAVSSGPGNCWSCNCIESRFGAGACKYIMLAQIYWTEHEAPPMEHRLLDFEARLE